MRDATCTISSAALLLVLAFPPLAMADVHGVHWSLRPVERPPLPVIGQPERPANPIDCFILAQLESVGLAPALPADRVTLIRRVSFDLTGLPPTPRDVDAFVDDASPDAYRKLIDRLLESPAYGQRWAQHWLDLARFAETDGFEHDQFRPDAWRYRDWVIGAMNRDMPYDLFVQLQLAADELAAGDEQALLATGFLLAGQDMPDLNLQEERRHNLLNEMTSTVGEVFLAMTFGCAQCHDHKADPISEVDFYSLRAFFANTVHPQDKKQIGSVAREPGPDAPTEHVRVRGDFRNRGREVQPAYPRALNPSNEAALPPPPGAASSHRRAALARWLTDPQSGAGRYVARVMVNRLWQHHFGKPLVATPGDFGAMGAAPTHPQLLDWLATEFIRTGWSLKAMHRLMLTSATYRQTSYGAGPHWARRLELDPDNALLSRMNRLRLSGETLRDAMLACGDRLVLHGGGPGVRPPLPDEVAITLLRQQWPVSEDPADHHRRSIYIFARRNLRYPFFEVFDRPDAVASCPQRSRSTTARQSLTLMNAPLAVQAARHLAGRLLAEHPASADDRIERCYRLTLGRAPDPQEHRLAAQFIEMQTAVFRQERRGESQLALPIPSSPGMEPAAAAALTDFCLAMLNVNEFFYLD